LTARWCCEEKVLKKIKERIGNFLEDFKEAIETALGGRRPAHVPVPVVNDPGQKVRRRY
jgi:hypothetical protein